MPPVVRIAALVLPALFAANAFAASPGAERFESTIQPILREYCYDCHGDGMNKGEVSLDTFATPDAATEDPTLWLRVLKNVRSGLMPPPKKPQPDAAARQKLEAWITKDVFRDDPANPDPGRVTVRRLNRVEYRNTIRDLLGVDFDTEKEFPPDDAGHGFDNIGDVLTLPPMLLEKYLGAAQAVVRKGVPAVSRVPAEEVMEGRRFTRAATNGTEPATTGPGGNGLALSYYAPGTATLSQNVRTAGRYQVLLDFTANEKYVDNQFDYNRCRVLFRIDGQEVHRAELGREGNKAFHLEFDRTWEAGMHPLEIEVQPLTPDQKQIRSLTLRLDSVTIRGPLAEEHWVRPANHERFFPKDPPTDLAARRAAARSILDSFAGRAYRRPVDATTVDRLVALAEGTWQQPGKTFEAGIGQAMVAVLASPRFLFREESIDPGSPAGQHPLVDEYSLASRLSYFLWASMPDAPLLEAARKGTLRKEQPAQLARMLADPRSQAFFRNFVGQWLQVRDVDTISIDSRAVLSREAVPDPDLEKKRRRSRELRDRDPATLTPEEKQEAEELRNSLFRRFGQPLRAELTGDIRRAMRLETEKVVEHVVRNDRSLLELIDSDYTFLNERLARYYGLTNLAVSGDEMVRVQLPKDGARGGVLTHGSVLVVTSNPTRTSPVKRGLFVLENILGTPPPPPPPDIPPLEDAAKAMREKTLTLRETLALHREQPSCSSCHNRMDPLGLALENFNAMGLWRDQERGEAVDPAGSLVSGETFSGVRDLKRILASGHRTEFYRTLSEKLLTYALGRGLDYRDVATIDALVARLEASGGRPSVLLAGIVDSPAFQRTRAPGIAGTATKAKDTP